MLNGEIGGGEIRGRRGGGREMGGGGEREGKLVVGK